MTLIHTGKGESMKSAQTIGRILLGLWLLIYGAVAILEVTIPMAHVVLGGLALLAGLMTLLGL